MNLLENINFAISHWSESSLLYKVLMVILLILGISSTMSLLPKNIIEWRGPILDAIEFYRSYLRAPIIEYAGSIGFKFGKVDTDFLTLSLLIYMSVLRGCWYKHVSVNDDILVFCFQCLVLLGGFYFAANSLSGQSTMEMYLEVFPEQEKNVNVLDYLFLFVPIMIISLINTDAKERAVMLAPIKLTIIILSILGALNLGLSK